MDNPLNNLYKNKEYGWFFFYIIVEVSASMYGGALGAIISFLMVAGLYKTVKNNNYSVGKKSTIAILYILAGIAIFWLVAYLLAFTITKIWGERALDSVNPEFREAQSRILSNETFKENSTSTSVSSTTPVNTVIIDKNLEKVSYVDSEYKFGINYPKGWIINTDSVDTTVEFNTPRNDEVAIVTVTAEKVNGYDLQTYSKLVIQGFYSSQQGANKNLKIISEGNTTLAGKSAYKFETTFDYVNGSDVYPFHGYYVVLVDNNMGYVLFVSTFENLWSKYKETFNASVASFKLPN